MSVKGLLKKYFMTTSVSGNAKVSNNSGPRVMAYIGCDDPNRGDSKAAIGLASLVAEMLNGRYVYVNHKTLKKLPGFSNALQKSYYADIAIGTKAKKLDKKQIQLRITDINENLSRSRADSSHLVSHHLTDALLEQKGKEFDTVYAGRIKGELIGVLMGGTVLDPYELGQKMANICRNYDNVTVFVCPSQRTGIAKDHLVEGFKNQVAQFDVDSRSRIYLQDVDYKNAIKKYNPYNGLLGRADHLCFTGESDSILSEALFTGKTVFTYNAQDGGLRSKGLTSNIRDLCENQPLPTQNIERPDVTRDVAMSIAREYLDTVPENKRPKIMCPVP